MCPDEGRTGCTLGLAPQDMCAQTQEVPPSRGAFLVNPGPNTRGVTGGWRVQRRTGGGEGRSVNVVVAPTRWAKKVAAARGRRCAGLQRGGGGHLLQIICTEAQPQLQELLTCSAGDETARPSRCPGVAVSNPNDFASFSCHSLGMCSATKPANRHTLATSQRQDTHPHWPATHRIPVLVPVHVEA